MVPTFAVAQDEDGITRIDFIDMFSSAQPNNRLLPLNHEQLSREDLYSETVENMVSRGYKVLEGKNPEGILTTQEFIRTLYAFVGGPQGKSLFEQKIFLKKRGVINTADVGLISGIKGVVFQQHEREPERDKAQLADPLFMKDQVETDLDAKANFTFDDGSTLMLGEDALVTITKHIYNPETDFRETVVKVSLGTVRFVVSKIKGKNSSFKIETPSATAGVLGTEFGVIVAPAGGSNWLGISGTFEVVSNVLWDVCHPPDEVLIENLPPECQAEVHGGEQKRINKDGSSSGVEVASNEAIEELIENTKGPVVVPPVVNYQQAALAVTRVLAQTAEGFPETEDLFYDLVNTEDILEEVTPSR
ncbi:MAG: FecR domain-containing protein [Nitrospinales bacterium]